MNVEIYDYASLVAKRRGIFMINNVEELYLYLIGYHNGKDDGTNFFQEFNEFVNENHGILNETVSWYSLIRLRSASDTHSIELFQYYLEEFMEKYK